MKFLRGMALLTVVLLAGCIGQSRTFSYVESQVSPVVMGSETVQASFDFYHVSDLDVHYSVMHEEVNRSLFEEALSSGDYGSYNVNEVNDIKIREIYSDSEEEELYGLTWYEGGKAYVISGPAQARDLQAMYDLFEHIHR